MAASMIDIEYLKQLLEIFDSSSVHDLRIEQEGVEIKLSKSPRREDAAPSMHGMQYAPMPMQMPAAPAAMPQQETASPSGGAPAQAAAASSSDSQPAKAYHEIRSPIVGTVDSAPHPDSPSYL